MASNATFAPPATLLSDFGRLDWTISEGFQAIFGPAVLWITNILFFFQLTVVIFLINELRKKESDFKSAFFKILFILCLLDAITKTFSFLLNITLQSSDIIYSLYKILTWYLNTSTGVFHFALTLNRFTSVVMPFKQKKYWTGKRFFCICIILLIYSFLVQIIFCSQLFWETLTGGRQCTSLVTANLVLDAIYGATSTVLLTYSAIHYIKKYKTLSSKNQRPEIIFLFQAWFTSVFFLLSVICRWLVTRNNSDISMMSNILNYRRNVFLLVFLYRLSEFLYIFYHYAGLIILFFA